MEENRILTLRDNAKADLLQIKTVEDGITHLNKLKSIETWVKAEKKDAELQNIVAEQKLRTQRILGEILGATELNTGTLKVGESMPAVEDTNHGKKLSEYGLTKDQSSTFQKIASIPSDKFEAFIKEKKDAVNNAVAELTTAGALRLITKTTQTYEEENRLAGYFNTKYAISIRAYAHDKNMDISDVIVLMGREFIDSIPESEQRRMRDLYLKDLKLGEVK